MPVIVRRDRVGEYLQRKGGYGLRKVLVPDPVAKGGKKERRRLSRNPRYGQQDSRKDPRQRGLQHYANGHPELADAQGQRGRAAALGPANLPASGKVLLFHVRQPPQKSERGSATDLSRTAATGHVTRRHGRGGVSRPGCPPGARLAR